MPEIRPKEKLLDIILKDCSLIISSLQNISAKVYIQSNNNVNELETIKNKLALVRNELINIEKLIK